MEVIKLRNARLHNQQITHNPCNVPETVIAQLGAIQAQDYQGAKWSIGMRLKGGTDDIVEKALIDKSIVRTWLMRGTLFFVNSNDLRWMQQLLAPKIINSLKRRYAELELDAATLVRCNSIIAEALTNTKILSRRELLTIIEGKSISTEGQRAAHILQHAAFHNLICQTNTIKNIPNYISTEQLKTKNVIFAREEAIAELVKRYFTSRGPATLQDFVWWSGLTVSETKAAIESIKTSLVSETLDGQIYWFSPDLPSPAHSKSLIQFMPGFDEFLLGYKDRSVSLNPQFNTRWCPGNNGMFMPFIAKDGQVIGTWKRTIKRDKINIETNFFNAKTNLTKQEIAQGINRYTKFLNKTIED